MKRNPINPRQLRTAGSRAQRSRSSPASRHDAFRPGSISRLFVGRITISVNGTTANRVIPPASDARCGSFLGLREGQPIPEWINNRQNATTPPGLFDAGLQIPVPLVREFLVQFIDSSRVDEHPRSGGGVTVVLGEVEMQSLRETCM